MGGAVGPFTVVVAVAAEIVRGASGGGISGAGAATTCRAIMIDRTVLKSA